MDLTGSGLTTGAVAGAARRTDVVRVTDAALARIAQSYDHAVRLSAQRRVYGRSTGVGANRTIVVAPTDATAQALLASHATSAGELRAPERIRAMMLIRLNQLCAGGAGLRPEVVVALAELINSGAVPPVRELSGIGTGDLSALATIGLALQQAGDAGLGAHDALPFLSSNAATLADAALAVDALAELADASLVVAALVFSVLDGNPEAFAPPVELATPFAGSRTTCEQLRQLLPAPPQPRRIQDPYGLRALPQVHGVLLDALARARSVTEAMINAPSENPLILPDGSLAHHGGFYAGHLAAGADAARSALASAAELALTRLTYLSEPAHTGLQPFLGDGTPGASGVMVCEYVSGAALAKLRAAATPAAIQSISLSRNVEDDASFASLACAQLLAGPADFAVILGAELVAAARGARQRGIDPAALSPGLGSALEIAYRLPSDDADRDLTADLQAARALLPELAQIMSSSGRSSSA